VFLRLPGGLGDLRLGQPDRLDHGSQGHFELEEFSDLLGSTLFETISKALPITLQVTPLPEPIPETIQVILQVTLLVSLQASHYQLEIRIGRVKYHKTSFGFFGLIR
jgi:hypothetical protein